MSMRAPYHAHLTLHYFVTLLEFSDEENYKTLQQDLFLSV